LTHNIQNGLEYLPASVLSAEWTQVHMHLLLL
jgi:hypothetical protein